MPAVRDLKSCQSCGSSHGLMYVCDRCLVVNYCSQRCCDRDWKNHKDDCRFYTWQQRHACLTFCQFCLSHTCHHSTHLLERCEGCLMVSYCSPSCQIRDWAAHASICPGNKNEQMDELEPIEEAAEWPIIDKVKVGKKKKTNKSGKEKEAEDTIIQSAAASLKDMRGQTEINLMTRRLFAEADLPYDRLHELNKEIQGYKDAMISGPSYDVLKLKMDLGMPSDLNEHSS